MWQQFQFCSKENLHRSLRGVESVAIKVACLWSRFLKGQRSVPMPKPLANSQLQIQLVSVSVVGKTQLSNPSFDYWWIPRKVMLLLFNYLKTKQNKKNSNSCSVVWNKLFFFFLWLHHTCLAALLHIDGTDNQSVTLVLAVILNIQQFLNKTFVACKIFWKTDRNVIG